MTDLSILIPARNEMFLRRTIEDILAHREGDTNILVGLDGAWADPQLEDNTRVVILHYAESIGQRAITNQLCRLTDAKYVMKVDAHCAFDQGFDVKLMSKMEDDITMAPVMRNLHAFNWKCPDGHTRYQSPSGPCLEKLNDDGDICDKPTTRDVVWIPKTNPQSWAYCFDPEPHFQYANEHKIRVGREGLTETMSLQGSCFMLTRDKYWELDICDETFGSWGSQGIEVAAKTWLSGGRVLVNHDTWYAHMFRTQGGDFSFPYEQSGRQVERAKKLAKEVFFNDKWDKAIHPLSWLVEKFWPVPGWSDADLAKLKEPKGLTKGILYYTDNRLNMRLADRVRRQISKAGLPITSVSLKRMKFGKNLRLPLERSILTMYKQILAGLEAMTEDIVYFTEHDVLYHPSHFEFTPTDPNKFYYNGNYWFARLEDGYAVHYNDNQHLSGLVGFRKQLLAHFKERVALIEKDGFRQDVMGFEPMTHSRIKWKNQYGFEVFMPAGPNIDLATGENASRKRWSIDEFQKKPSVWEEGTIENIPEWGNARKCLE